MSKFEDWLILNKVKGFYFSWKEIEPNACTFSFKNAQTEYKLIVESFWRILYYDEPYILSTNATKSVQTDLLLKHSQDDFIIDTVTLAEGYVLRFLLKGKLVFEIPILTKNRSDYKGSLKPVWSFWEKDTLLVASPEYK